MDQEQVASLLDSHQSPLWSSDQELQVRPIGMVAFFLSPAMLSCADGSAGFNLTRARVLPKGESVRKPEKNKGVGAGCRE